MAYSGVTKADVETRVAKLARTDEAWLLDAAARTAALRALWPAKPGDDKAAFDAAYQAVLSEVLARSAR